MRGGSGAGCWRGRRRGRLRFGGSGGFFGGVGTARTKDGVFGGDAGLGGVELVLFFELENWGWGGGGGDVRWWGGRRGGGRSFEAKIAR